MRFTHDANYEYRSRRSVVLSPSAAVASSQPVATEAGIHVLRSGGSAADAAIAVAAALQVTQACSTGLGGDAFCLYYEAATGTVHAYNGSGRSPRALTAEAARAAARDGGEAAAAVAESSLRLPDYHVHTVTVPGAADAWFETHRRFGRLPLADVLSPAIRLARDGFALGPMTARWWSGGIERQVAARRHGQELMIDGRSPAVGERVRNAGLARVFESLAADGREGFYEGWIAERIVEEIEYEGGCMSADDLAAHRGEWVKPISIHYHGFDVWECPPNGQGLAALLALRIYAQVPPEMRAEPADRLHAQVEAMRLAFADAARHVADPVFAPAPVGELLGDEYTASRAADIRRDRAMTSAGPGLPARVAGDDTVYFSVLDAEGNGCSFINSNFAGFGTGIVPRGCGFTLQNRGLGFVLEPGHANELAPGKRPYHTIIPGLMTRDGRLAAVFGVMGGMMQPQGHLQVVSRLVDDGLDPQSALDAARFQLAGGDPDGALLLEENSDPGLVADLAERGHEVEQIVGKQRASFGLGQVIARGDDVLWSGSDPRGDGQAGGF